MPSSLSFSGSIFKIISVEQVSPNALRVTYSQDPLSVSSTGTNDALNKTNYNFVGPVSNSVSGITTVVSNPQQVVVSFANPLEEGSWIVSVSNINTTTANPLVPNPQSFSFQTRALTEQPQLSIGATGEDAFSTLKKFIPTKYKKTRNWLALIEAISRGDQYIKDLSQFVYKQLFVSTASGKYLDQRGFDEGLGRPTGVGFRDAPFRDLIVGLKNEKITLQSFLRVLQAFYTDEQTRAYITSGLYEPFNLSDGDELKLTLDGKLFTVVFEEDDFSIPNAATAIEVANVFNRYFVKNNLLGFAKAFTDSSGFKYVRLFSSALGLKGSLQINGGSAQNYLQFPTKNLTTQAPTTQWTIATQTTPTVVKFTYTSGTNPSISLLSVGDYVNIYGSVFNPLNQGSFEIIEVGLDYFKIKNKDAVNEVVTQTSTNDILFFTPNIFRLNNYQNVAFAAQGGDVLDIYLPVTTDAISRTRETGTYLHEDFNEYKRANLLNSKYSITNIQNVGTTSAILTIGSHNISVGDKVLFYPGWIPDWNNSLNRYIEEGSYAVSAVGATTITISGVNNYVYNSAVSNLYVTANFKDSTGKLNLKIDSDASLMTVGNTVVTENLTVDTYPTNSYSQGANDWESGVGSYDELLIYEAKSAPLGSTELFIHGGAIGTIATSASYIVNTATKRVTSVSAVGTAVRGHCLVALDDNKILSLGGAGATAIRLYDREYNRWAFVSDLPNSVLDGRAVLMPNNTVLVYGGNVSTSYPQLINLATNTASVLSFEVTNPTTHLLIKNNDGQALAFCGATTQVWMYDCWQNVFKRMADYSSPMQMSGGMFWNGFGPKGAFVVAGGYDGSSVVATVKYLETEKNTWVSLPDMPAALYNPKLYSISDDEFVVWGGTPESSSPFTPNTNVYVYNKFSNSWRIERTLLNTNGTKRFIIQEIVNGKEVIMQNNKVKIYDNVISRVSGKLNKVSTVTAINSTSQVQLSSLNDTTTNNSSPISYRSLTNEGTYETGLLIRAKNLSMNTVGYYWTDRQFPISSLYTTTTTTIDSGASLTELPVTSNSAFPESGFVVLGYGTIYQTGPIEFKYKIGSTILSIDPNFIFDKLIPSGTSVIYSTSRDYADFSDFPSINLTDSSVPRIYAEDTIDKVAAVGSRISKTILYPSTIGLGNSQIDTNISGKPKLNDAIYIWGNQSYLDKKRGE